MQIWHRAAVLLIAAATVVAAAQPPRDTLSRLADSCADVRKEAAQHPNASNGRPDAAVIARLTEMLKSEPFPDIRDSAIYSLSLVKPLAPLVPALIAALDDPFPEVAERAAGTLGYNVDDPRSAARLVELADDPNDHVRPSAQSALAALIRRGVVTDDTITRRLIAAVSKDVRDPSYEARGLRIRAMDLLGRIRHPDVVPVLIAGLLDPDVRWAALRATRQSTDRRLVGPLLTIVQSAESGQPLNLQVAQADAASALGRIKDSGAVAPLLAVLRKPNLAEPVATAIAAALGEIGSASAEADVRALVTSPSQKTRDAAAAALPKLVDTAPPRVIPAAELRMPTTTELLGPPLKRMPDYGYTLFVYEIPEGYHGFLVIDYDTPGCPPLQEIDGRMLIRFDKNGHACTSTGFRESSRKAPSLAYRVGGRGRVPMELDTDLSEYVFAPLPPTDRLPSRTTWRAAMFAGTKAELRAASGCTP